MRSLRIAAACLAVAGTLFLNGCSCCKSNRSWGRPSYRPNCDPVIVSPGEVNVTPMPEYRSGN